MDVSLAEGKSHFCLVARPVKHMQPFETSKGSLFSKGQIVATILACFHYVSGENSSDLIPFFVAS